MPKLVNDLSLIVRSEAVFFTPCCSNTLTLLLLLFLWLGLLCWRLSSLLSDSCSMKISLSILCRLVSIMSELLLICWLSGLFEKVSVQWLTVHVFTIHQSITEPEASILTVGVLAVVAIRIVIILPNSLCCLIHESK